VKVRVAFERLDPRILPDMGVMVTHAIDHGVPAPLAAGRAADSERSPLSVQGTVMALEETAAAVALRGERDGSILSIHQSEKVRGRDSPVARRESSPNGPRRASQRP